MSENNTPSSDLYVLDKMQLHDLETFHDGHVTVLRVLGGWIYTIIPELQREITSVFVPDTRR